MYKIRVSEKGFFTRTYAKLLDLKYTKARSNQTGVRVLLERKEFMKSLLRKLYDQEYNHRNWYILLNFTT